MRSLVLALTLAACTAEGPVDGAPEPEVPVELLLEPAGPNPADVEAFAASLDARAEVVAAMNGHRSRQMRFEVLADEVDGRVEPGSRFVAVYWDYDDNRSFEVRGDMNNAASLVVDASPERLAPTLDEVEEARNIAMSDPQIRAAVESGTSELFRAMPPTIDHPEGHRVVAMGVRSLDDETQGEIFGVDLSDGVVLHFPDGQPPTSRVGGFVCNPPPYSPGAGPARGTQGWARLRMVRGGQEVWSMFVRRPASSGGPNGSGVELMDVRFQGERVLNRAHLPILNVLYDQNTCGPYRDWQWQENPFEVGTTLAEPAPGIRLVDWAKTMRETNSDAGTFSGVAAYWDAAHQQGVIISELEAGWYRYMSEWRFSLDGTINPRFGFDAVQNWCTCQLHTHHGYWRLDFDIGSGNNRIAVREGGGAWQPIDIEANAVRDDALQREWIVQDAQSGRGYTLRPPPGEDLADAYGVADAWFLAAKTNEIDDAGTNPPMPTQAGLNAYLNNENIRDVDNVVWWGGHFLHDDTDPTANQTHTVQLLLTPVNW